MELRSPRCAGKIQRNTPVPDSPGAQAQNPKALYTSESPILTGLKTIRKTNSFKYPLLLQIQNTRGYSVAWSMQILGFAPEQLSSVVWGHETPVRNQNMANVRVAP